MKTKKILTLYWGIIVGVLIVALVLGSCKKENFNPNLTDAFTVQSPLNGVTYNIKVGLPINYQTTSKQYASVYVLDGQENFDFVANRCQRISGERGTENVIVVSIGYGNDRNLDYTPTKISSITGGGDRFLDFIKTSLIPAIEQRYRVDTARQSRVLLGHSYGGLFGAYAFAVRNEVFGNYILLSPSIWFDNEVVLQFEKDKRALNKDRHQIVFLGIGKLENLGRMQAPFEAFYQILNGNYSNIKIAKHIEADLDHMGSKNPNIENGLNYYFQNR